MTEIIQSQPEDASCEEIMRELSNSIMAKITREKVTGKCIIIRE